MTYGLNYVYFMFIATYFEFYNFGCSVYHKINFQKVDIDTEVEDDM